VVKINPGVLPASSYYPRRLSTGPSRSGIMKASKYHDSPFRVKAAFKQKSKERDAMSNPTDPRRENPNTYFVQDRSNEEEAIRLRVQDQMTTAGMGGVLPEQSDPTAFQRVLDVGCGTGNWLIEAAKTFPTMV